MTDLAQVLAESNPELYVTNAYYYHGVNRLALYVNELLGQLGTDARAHQRGLDAQLVLLQQKALTPLAVDEYFTEGGSDD